MTDRANHNKSLSRWDVKIKRWPIRWEASSYLIGYSTYLWTSYEWELNCKIHWTQKDLLNSVKGVSAHLCLIETDLSSLMRILFFISSSVQVSNQIKSNQIRFYLYSTFKSDFWSSQSAVHVIKTHYYNHNKRQQITTDIYKKQNKTHGKVRSRAPL